MKPQTRNPLKPLILQCQKQRGLKSIVLTSMVKQGVPGNWANLSGWLHPDPEKRRTPKPETLAGLLKICAELGLEPDELLRLKHVTGFSKLFKDAEFKQSWTTPEQVKIKQDFKKGKLNNHAKREAEHTDG